MFAHSSSAILCLIQKDKLKSAVESFTGIFATIFPLISAKFNGVCTDVVAFALKDAGYDLMVLVNEDIKNNKELYDIDAVDKNIDFRRVKNLKVYFDNNAISLTTDINETEEWQGGDIVVFKKHIGIISDKRNRKGICFVIHHANPYQIYYEEDILEHRDDIIGHYRIS